MRISAILLISALSLTACHNEEKQAPPDFLVLDLDTTVSPATDFFEYANGGWIKSTPIPAAESGWGVGNLVQEDIYLRLRNISEKAAHSDTAKSGSVSQKIGDLWTSGMDSADIEKQGIKPLQPEIDSIRAIHDITGLLHTAAGLQGIGVGCLFGDFVGQDDKNSNAMAYQLYQGGLGLPNRDYYFNTDEKSTKVRDAYKHYLYLNFRELGADDATANQKTTNVFALETRLAAASRKLAALRNPVRNYNKYSWLQLKRLTPALSWEEWFQSSGIKPVDSVIVGQPEFYTALDKALTGTPIDTWKDYLQSHLIQSSASYLDSTTFNNYFNFQSTRTGATAPRPRWKRALDAEERAMGEALGQLFVQEYFPPAARQRYSDLVENMRAAYKERIRKLSWMSDSTKKLALDKLSRMTKKVGYPDHWKDFSALTIDRGPWILNMQRASAWWHHYNLDKLGKPVDRTEWGMSPQTYNAYYNSSNNEIVLPAGQFTVPGKKDDELDDAFVYGYAAASTIGHEMTHGFDDEGRKYDADGNLHEWWQPADSAHFVQHAAFIIRQFNEFNPVDTLHVNGDATQGENIADLGGLVIGLDAFKKTAAYTKNEKIGGFTPLQRYFLGYAYGWLYQERKEELASQLMTDVHAPAKERVNGPMANLPDFYEAFGVKPGDKMYRPDSLRVVIW
ncbi:MAG TPA: M13 family metallopeptidase [Puia sp.]|jgi:putative endopeptidase|nr:M13 family metallopeptidase [Puia sp.]